MYNTESRQWEICQPMPILLKDLLANFSSTCDLADQVSGKVPDLTNLVSIAHYHTSMPFPALAISPSAPTPAPSVATPTPVPSPTPLSHRPQLQHLLVQILGILQHLCAATNTVPHTDCYNCSEPASVRCSTNNLVLCQECDWDAHGTCSISASHERSPLEDFSGCPSPLELASIWGFDICGEKKALQPPAPPLPSTMSPQVNHMVLSSWLSLDMLLSIDPLAYKSESAANITLQELVVPSDNTLLYQHDPCADVYQQENGRKRK
ncbi:hypothetical protein NE237_026088 [Protea cynaroides]|uniref:Uncharacterized protein n=1 Tax=Protea cynaroides TaxID=273540 RepID=A0A9Q0H7H4_9MAGN|nr:hypothetical protein NE237_026088 [Protea cynaroides]